MKKRKQKFFMNWLSVFALFISFAFFGLISTRTGHVIPDIIGGVLMLLLALILFVVSEY